MTDLSQVNATSAQCGEDFVTLPVEQPDASLPVADAAVTADDDAAATTTVESEVEGKGKDEIEPVEEQKSCCCQAKPASTTAKKEEKVDKTAEPTIPEGYRRTDFPCFPCRRDGKECYVSRCRDVMPCTNRECTKSKADCRADQRVPYVPVRMSSSSAKGYELFHIELESVKRRILSALFEYAHCDKVKVGGRWTKEDWTPIDMTVDITTQPWREAARLFDSEIEADVDDLRSFLYELEIKCKADLNQTVEDMYRQKDRVSSSVKTQGVVVKKSVAPACCGSSSSPSPAQPSAAAADAAAAATITTTAKLNFLEYNIDLLDSQCKMVDSSFRSMERCLMLALRTLSKTHDIARQHNKLAKARLFLDRLVDDSAVQKESV